MCTVCKNGNNLFSTTYSDQSVALLLRYVVHCIDQYVKVHAGG
jgi:hypothetical protein